MIQIRWMVTCAALCGALLGWGSEGKAAPNTRSPRILVLYEGRKEKQDDAVVAGIRMRATLGHFRADITTRSVTQYERGSMQRFDFVFFIGTYPQYDLPLSFLHDITHYQGTICWVGGGLEQLPHHQLARWNLTLPRVEMGRDFQGVIYHKQTFRLDDRSILHVASLRDPRRSEVVASMQQKGKLFPYLLRTGNFWYVPEDPFARAGEGDRCYAFADALHDILRQSHGVKRQVILRIEDVNLSDDMDDLRRIADLLSERHVPFVISLVPVYINPDKGVDVAMSSRRDFVRAVKYMIAHGGTVLMHGDTHRYQGISTDDYEFWDKTRNGPISEDSAEYVESHLAQGLRVCFDSGIYPVAWETPHFAASMLDYQVIARHFRTVVEQRVYDNSENFGQDFPYRIAHDWFGQQVLPDNAGYVPLALVPGTDKEDLTEERKSVQEIINHAQRYKCVRDVFAGVFFHPFLNTELLPTLVEGLRRAGYTFVDLKQFDNRVTLGDKCVITGSGTMSVTLKHDYLREIWLDPRGKVRRDLYSSTPLNGAITKKIQCRPGWVYVAEGARSRPPSVVKVWMRRVRDEVHQFLESRAKKLTEPHVVIVWNAQARGALARDQESLECTYKTAGLQPLRLFINRQGISADNLADANWLIVPQASAAAMTKNQREVVADFVRRGGNLVTDGYSGLSLRFEITPSNLKEVVRVAYDSITHLPLNWSLPASIRIPNVPEADFVLYRDKLHRHPLGFTRDWGKGTVVFLATLFDPVTGWGYARFPSLITNTMKVSRFQPTLRSPSVEVYFDPAYRENISIEPLVVQWRQAGVRAVHVAMWYDYPGFAENHKPYDYGRLIRNCHANGILVYAWFEPPYLTRKFWEDHPQWHEKNWKGEDVKAGWRYPLAMEIPACKQVILSEMKRTLHSYAWDGINVAEVNFESGGPEEPDKFQPMHPYFRQQFKQRHGFDPAEALNPRSHHYFQRNHRSWQLLEDERVNLVTQWHCDVLQAVAEDQSSRKFPLDVIVTAQDSLHAPHLRRMIGLDIQDILRLMQRYDFTLNVEDPEEMWDLPPDRYERIGADFRRLVRDPRKLMLDINIVDLDSRKGGQHDFAVQRATGAELTALIYSSLKQVHRVVLYSESNVLPQDMPFLASAYASVNGEHWTSDLYPPMADDTPDPNDVPFPRVLRITGQLLGQQRDDQDLTLRYRSHARCLLSLADIPAFVWVDGKRYTQRFRTGYHCQTVSLPAGEHTVRILQEGQAMYHVQIFGDRLSTAIVGGGKWACLMLFGMFVWGRRHGRRDQSALQENSITSLPHAEERRDSL